MWNTTKEDHQGYLGQLDQKSRPQLVELLQRQEKLLKNQKFLDTLSDRGEKIRTRAEELRRLIAAKEVLDQTTDLLAGMKLQDEEMRDVDQDLQLDEKDVSVISREDRVKEKKKAFCPHRTLRSNLGDLLEEVAAESARVAPAPKLIKSEFADLGEMIPKVEELIAQSEQLTPGQLGLYESKCCNLHTTKPSLHHLDNSQSYTVVPFCLLTNRPGENAEICRLVARTSDKSFSEYTLPTYISTGITKNYGVKIEYNRAVRILTKNGENTNAQPITILLKNFAQFLGGLNFERIVLLGVGQSSTLLHNFKTNKIAPPDVLYASCAKNIVTSTTFERTFSEQRIVDILNSLLEKSLPDLLNSCQIYDLKNAEIALQQSIEFNKRLNSFRGKLFDFSIKEKEVISADLAKNLSRSGLEYCDLENLYKESELALVAMVMRVTKDVREMATIMRYFKHKHGSQKFAEALMEGRGERASKFVPLEESLRLLNEQKKRIERTQVEQAKQRLLKNVTVNLKMKSFDPESTKSSLAYREKQPVEEESDEEEGKEEEEDSEEEQDYPE